MGRDGIILSLDRTNSINNAIAFTKLQLNFASSGSAELFPSDCQSTARVATVTTMTKPDAQRR